MISLLSPESTYTAVGRGTILVFDVRTQPSAGKLKIGDTFTSLGQKYQVLAIERATYLTSPPTISPKVHFVVKELND